MYPSISADAAVAAYLKSMVPGGSMPPDDLPARVDRDQVIRLATDWMWDTLRESDNPAADLALMVGGLCGLTWWPENLTHALEELEGRVRA